MFSNETDNYNENLPEGNELPHILQPTLVQYNSSQCLVSSWTWNNSYHEYANAQA